MRPSRSLLAGVGAAVLLLVPAPATAYVPRSELAGATSAGELDALRLLEQAAVAAVERGFAGTQQVDTWQGGVPRSAVQAVRHEPGRGLQVLPAVATAAASVVDARLLPVLARRYDLAVTRTGRCAGRTATVVEARRPDGTVAGRFHLDRATGLALRREVYDTAGRPVRTAAFRAVTVAVARRAVPVAIAPAGPMGTHQARAASWASPEVLPGGFARVAAPPPAHAGPGVQHLAWSDGLSTVSVFAQDGRTGAPASGGFAPHDVDGSTVWASHEGPERLVWNGGGRVFTLVSDAGPDDVLAVVRALPHDPDPERGLRARLLRGLSRIGSWLDPTG